MTTSTPENLGQSRQPLSSTGDLLPFRFALEAQEAHIHSGGSSKQASVVEFPISQNIAAVSMWLQPGGLRELHWHANAAEWAYMLAGQARVTVFDPWGRWETTDFGPGDVWYFPRGHGHSIQGLGTQECHFILGFDNGAFSEFGTFSLTDWVAHTPPEVLAKNLGVPSTTFNNFPKSEVYMVQGSVPPPLPDMPPAGSLKAGPLTHKYQLAAQQPQPFNGGFERRVSAKQFPISTTLTGVTMTLFPGGLRELHWHPNADEWQYFISGHAQITIFGSSGRARTEEFGPGDVGYVPLGHGHYIENVGSEECHILIILSNGEYQAIFLTDWLSSNPQQLVATNFGVSEDLVERFAKIGQQREP